jgi:hypothetical protein
MATASTHNAENLWCQISGDRTVAKRPINRLVEQPAQRSEFPIAGVLRGAKHDVSPIHRSSIGNDPNERRWSAMGNSSNFATSAHLSTVPYAYHDEAADAVTLAVYT